MVARLKVFTWSDGFHAFTVATSSRPKALKAWGSRQDLFASGLASQVTEGADYDAALAAPEEVIRRGLSVDIGEVSKAGRQAGTPSAARTAGAKAKARTNARIKAKIDELETQLATLDIEHGETVLALDSAAAEIELKRATAEASHGKKRKRIVGELKVMRRKV